MSSRPVPLVLGIVNPKGGTGKTTVAVHLGVAAHRSGYDTTLLDTDPQASVWDWHRRSPDEYDGPTVERVGKDRTIAAAVQQAGTDVVVVDSPARLDERTGRVLSASDLALVPVRPSGLDLWGTVEFVDVLKRRVEDGGLTGAFVRSQADVRTSLSDNLTEAMKRLGLPLLDGLTLRVAYARSMTEGRTVLDAGDTTAAGEVRALLSDAADLLS
jgi:chromosome partitioning protein